MQSEKGFFIKDLRVIANRDIDKIVIVDNLVHSFAFQLNNGIPILEWRGSPDDEELKHLTGYLIKLSKAESVTEYNKKHYNLTNLFNFYTPKELLIQ